MARAEAVPKRPVEHEIVLIMTEAEARYVRGALLLVNPSAEARAAGCNKNDDVFDALGNALSPTNEDDEFINLLTLVVRTGNNPEGTE